MSCGTLISPFAAVAASVIGALGRVGTLTRTTNTYSDIDDTNTKTTVIYKIVSTPPTAYSTYEVANSANQVLASDLKVTLQAFGLVDSSGSQVVPQPEDMIDIGLPKKLKVVQCSPIYDATGAVIFKCQCRY